MLALLVGLHWTDYHQLEDGAPGFMQARYLFGVIGVMGLALAGAVSLAPLRARGALAGAAIGGLLASTSWPSVSCWSGSMRSAAVAFGAVFLAGLAAVAAVALTQRSSLEYSLGVKPALTATSLEKRTEVCQAPVRPPRGVTFDRVGFLLTTTTPPGPARPRGGARSGHASESWGRAG